LLINKLRTSFFRLNIFFVFIYFCSTAVAENISVQGESLVLHGSDVGLLSFEDIKPGTVVVRNSFDINAPNSILYKEGIDYVVDYGKGGIHRAKGSRIPDFSKSPAYEKRDFRLEDVPNLGNHQYFIWVDYESRDGSRWAEPSNQQRYLVKTRKKLESGGEFRVVTYGDSITAGAEASKPEYMFTHRYVNYLEKQFPRTHITLQDFSIPGYSSREGVEWFLKKPSNIDGSAIGSAKKPDLVIIGFGMNDHNLGGVQLKEFQLNLTKMVNLFKMNGADVILFSSFPPNENWHNGSHRMGQYAQATKEVAIKTKSAYVDVYGAWSKVLTRKDQSSLLNNDINHPNDFGHWLYEKAFEALVF